MDKDPKTALRISLPSLGPAEKPDPVRKVTSVCNQHRQSDGWSLEGPPLAPPRVQGRWEASPRWMDLAAMAMDTVLDGRVGTPPAAVVRGEMRDWGGWY